MELLPLTSGIIAQRNDKAYHSQRQDAAAGAQTAEPLGRYGCAASAKPRPSKISTKNLMPEQKVPINLITGQVFMNFRVPKLGFFSK